MHWLWVNIGGHPFPGAQARVQPAALRLYRLHFLVFITGFCQIVVLLRAILSSAVSPQARCLIFPIRSVAESADSQLLGGVNVAYHCPLLGAGIADQKATFSAVVSTSGLCEVVEAAHAFEGGLVWDPGNSKGGTRLAAAFLQQS